MSQPAIRVRTQLPRVGSASASSEWKKYYQEGFPKEVVAKLGLVNP